MLKKLLFTLLGLALIAAIAIGILTWLESQKFPKPDWSKSERSTISALWIGNLPPLSDDPSNRVANNIDAAKFGHQLFFDKRFSGNGKVACATCHDPDKHFTDGQALATGMGVTGRSSPSIVGTVYHPFIFWDGRADSQWAQAMGPMESAVEHGGTRAQYAHIVASDKHYRQQYEKLFGELANLSDSKRFPLIAGPVDAKANPEAVAAWQKMSTDDQKTITQIFVNTAKSIAAYERLLLPATSRFDHYAEAIKNQSDENLDSLSHDEIEGLRLFIGKGRCIECHNGALFTNDSFSNIGTPTPEGKPFDFGRSRGAQQVIKSEFNCAGEHSDAGEYECSELRFIKRVGDDIIGSFKVPGLRNTTATAPYMHAGQMKDLDEVMEHYNKPPAPPFGHSMLTKLDLEPYQLKQIIDFLHTLDSEVAAEPHWLQAPAAKADTTSPE